MIRRCLLAAALGLSACSSPTQTLGSSIQAPVAGS